MNVTFEKIRSLFDESEHIVLLAGSDMILEAGLNNILAENIPYDVEEKYGYSSDEIVTESFLTRRVDLFYDYYKNVILGSGKERPTLAIRCIKELQDEGKLDCVITKSVYEIFQRAGCRNVININGSVEHNKCPSCGKEFNSAYIRDSKGIAVCDKCKVPLRPGFSLIGEMIDSGRYADCINHVTKADTIVVAGCKLQSTVFRNLYQYYTGNRIILINTQEYVGDEAADYRIYGNISRIFGEVFKDVKFLGREPASDNVGEAPDSSEEEYDGHEYSEKDIRIIQSHN
ncbi:MAG: Sir2 family NAD-dependent protein deacetylase [Lachnospiraceae bacterium]|jgi:NAD-dependent deacetylase|nr:Sir2 family NAD-dependent protein deacetylase [Lachnospiraceae bacterium]MEE3461929.1 Sir2 family NAD-dependent protein deacetylase [Lachnospiraceae bacterium]